MKQVSADILQALFVIAKFYYIATHHLFMYLLCNVHVYLVVCWIVGIHACLSFANLYSRRKVTYSEWRFLLDPHPGQVMNRLGHDLLKSTS